MKETFDFRGSNYRHVCKNHQPHAPHVMAHYTTVRSGRLEKFCPGVPGPELIIHIEKAELGSPSHAARMTGWYEEVCNPQPRMQAWLLWSPGKEKCPYRDGALVLNADFVITDMERYNPEITEINEAFDGDATLEFDYPGDALWAKWLEAAEAPTAKSGGRVFLEGFVV